MSSVRARGRWRAELLLLLPPFIFPDKSGGCRCWTREFPLAGPSAIWSTFLLEVDCTNKATNGLVCNTLFKAPANSKQLVFLKCFQAFVCRERISSETKLLSLFFFNDPPLQLLVPICFLLLPLQLICLSLVVSAVCWLFTFFLLLFFIPFFVVVCLFSFLFFLPFFCLSVFLLFLSHSFQFSFWPSNKELPHFSFFYPFFLSCLLSLTPKRKAWWSAMHLTGIRTYWAVRLCFYGGRRRNSFLQIHLPN